MKMKMIFASIVMVFAFMVGFISPVKAQYCPDPSNTTISGTVYIRTPVKNRFRIEPAPNQLIEAREIYTSNSSFATTDSTGYFAFAGLNPCTNYYVNPLPTPYAFGSYTPGYPVLVYTGDSTAFNVDFDLYP